MPHGTTQDRQDTVKGSDKMWSMGGGNGNSSQYSCHEDPMNSMQRQKYMIPENGHPATSPDQKVSNMILGNSRKSRGQLLIAPERMKSQPKWKRRSVMGVSAGELKVRAERVIFRVRCPGCVNQSTPDPEQAAQKILPMRVTFGRGVRAFGSDTAPYVSPVLRGPDPGCSCCC